MALHRRLVLGSLAAIAGLPLLLSPIAKSAQPARTDCTVTVSGAEKPYLVPAQDVWEAAFRRQLQTSSESELSSSVRAKVNPHAEVALKRVAALRETLVAGTANPTQALRDRAQVIADTIIDARDEATRQLSDAEADAWNIFAAETATDLAFTLPLPGRHQTSTDGVTMCEVILKGSEYPYLLPEYVVWKDQFNGWSWVARQNLGPDGRLLDEYLMVVRRNDIRAAIEDIRTFLEFAIQVAADVDVIRGERVGDDAASSLAQELKVQRTVMRGRRSLMRALSIEGWRAVVQRVESARVGTEMWVRAAVEN